MTIQTHQNRHSPITLSNVKVNIKFVTINSFRWDNSISDISLILFNSRRAVKFIIISRLSRQMRHRRSDCWKHNEKYPLFNVHSTDWAHINCSTTIQPSVSQQRQIDIRTTCDRPLRKCQTGDRMISCQCHRSRNLPCRYRGLTWPWAWTSRHDKVPRLSPSPRSSTSLHRYITTTNISRVLSLLKSKVKLGYIIVCSKA